MQTDKPEFPMRINKYLAQQKYCTRREADEIIKKGLVSINGRPAVLGDKVTQSDKVELKWRQTKHRYFAYNKPRGIITHSAQQDEEEIKEILPIEGVFPLGRLDKDSYGLIILTDDGRITDALLNPERAHEKEYEVRTTDELPSNFNAKIEKRHRHRRLCDEAVQSGDTRRPQVFHHTYGRQEAPDTPHVRIFRHEHVQSGEETHYEHHTWRPEAWRIPCNTGRGIGHLYEIARILK